MWGQRRECQCANLGANLGANLASLICTAEQATRGAVNAALKL